MSCIKLIHGLSYVIDNSSTIYMKFHMNGNEQECSHLLQIKHVIVVTTFPWHFPYLPTITIHTKFNEEYDI